MRNPSFVLALALVLGCSDTSGSRLTGRVVLGDRGAASVLVTLTGPTAGATTTDTNGAFAFQGLAPGDYAVVAAVDSTLEKQRAASARVESGQTVAIAPLVFTPVGTLAGRVLVDGAPASARVRVDATRSVATAADGRYELELPAGSYTISATVGDLESASATITVEWAKRTEAPDLAIARGPAGGGRIVGRVRLTTAGSLAGATVSLTGPVSRTTTLGASGIYAFTDLPDGTYTIAADLPSSVPVTEDETSVTVASGAEVEAAELAFVPTGTLRGVVIVDGAPVEGAVVSVSESLQTTTDANGRWELVVPVGTYTVTATVGDAVAQESEVSVSHALVTETPELEPAPPTGRLSGSITLDRAGTFAGAQVSITGPRSLSTPTDGLGSWSIEELPDGEYVVTATLPSSIARVAEHVVTIASGAAVAVPAFTFTPVGVLAGRVLLDGAPTANATVSVSAQLTTTSAANGTYELTVPVGTHDVTATLGTKTAQIKGVSATHAQRAPVPDFTFTTATTGRLFGRALLEEPGSLTGATATLGGTSTGTSALDANGYYAFTGLAGGAYTVRVQIPGAAPTTTDQVSVSVSGGDVTATPLTFTRRGTISGRVLRQGGTPASNVEVRLDTTTSGGVTDSLGRFAVRASAGAHSVLAISGIDSVRSATVTIDPAKTHDVGDLVLAPSAQPHTGRLAGKVRWLNLTNHEGIRVQISGPASRESTTGSTGDYVFDNVPDGLYAVKFSSLHSVEGTLNRSGTVSGGGLASLPDAALTPAGDIAGTILLPGRSDHSGTAVFSLGWGRAAITDAAGAFRLRVPAGSRKFIAVSSGFVELSITTTVELAGTTTWSPTPTAGSTSAASTFGNLSLSNTPADFTGVTVTSGSVTGQAGNGRYSIGLPAGVHEVFIRKAGYAEVKVGPVVASSAGSSFYAAGALLGMPDVRLERIAEGADWKCGDAVPVTQDAVFFCPERSPVWVYRYGTKRDVSAASTGGYAAALTGDREKVIEYLGNFVRVVDTAGAEINSVGFTGVPETLITRDSTTLFAWHGGTLKIASLASRTVLTVQNVANVYGLPTSNSFVYAAPASGQQQEIRKRNRSPDMDTLLGLKKTATVPRFHEPGTIAFDATIVDVATATARTMPPDYAAVEILSVGTQVLAQKADGAGFQFGLANVATGALTPLPFTVTAAEFMARGNADHSIVLLNHARAPGELTSTPAKVLGVATSGAVTELFSQPATARASFPFAVDPLSPTLVFSTATPPACGALQARDLSDQSVRTLSPAASCLFQLANDRVAHWSPAQLSVTTLLGATTALSSTTPDALVFSPGDAPTHAIYAVIGGWRIRNLATGSERNIATAVAAPSASRVRWLTPKIVLVATGAVPATDDADYAWKMYSLP